MQCMVPLTSRHSRACPFSGIYDGCNKTAPNINHAVVLDGYGIENGTKYWLVRIPQHIAHAGMEEHRQENSLSSPLPVRNSWGENFGENGNLDLHSEFFSGIVNHIVERCGMSKVTYDCVATTMSPAEKIRTLWKVSDARLAGIVFGMMRGGT